MASIDKSVVVRDGEELPHDRVLGCLNEHLPHLEGPLTVEANIRNPDTVIKDPKKAAGE